MGRKKREARETTTAPRTLTFAQALELAQSHLAAGRMAAAEDLCQRMLAVEPHNGAALHLLGIVAYQAGNVTAALDLVRRASEAEPTSAPIFANLCELYRLVGRLDEALVAGRRALALVPDDAQAMNNLGIVHYEKGEHAVAMRLYQRALAQAPGYAAAANNLGNALRAMRRHEHAMAAYRRALDLRPDYPDALNNLGTALRDLGRSEEAEAAYRQALALRPDDGTLLSNLALALKDMERYEEAAALLDRAVVLAPRDVRTLAGLARVRLGQGRVAEADEICRHALELAPDDPAVLAATGLVRQAGERPDEALALLRRAAAARPDLADAHNDLGNILMEQGETAQAEEAFLRALAINPHEAGFYLNLAEARTFCDSDPRLPPIEKLARETDRLAPLAAARINFALAKAYDDLGRTDDAFRHMADANRFRRGLLAYDEAATLGLFDRVRAVFDGALMSARTGGGDRSQLPIFVLGMPRSGTTLIEQILASHPGVHGAGELPDLARLVGDRVRAEGMEFPEAIAALIDESIRALGGEYARRLRLRSPDAGAITDKMPSNFLFVGLIQLALPNARIIHVMRDPVDTCLSCFSKMFTVAHDYAYDLAELGRYYRAYRELMAHWRAVLPAGRMLEVRYEDVVTDLETSARQIIRHCDLTWDPRCLAFHATRRPVRTASAYQVRRPIYRTSCGRWHAYRRHLGPLLEALGDAVDSGAESAVK